MLKSLQLGCLVLFGVSCLHAAQMANLRNGFSIRHEHHEELGETTRLYLAGDPSGGYVEVATSQIESFEQAPPEATSPVAPTTRDLASIIRDASASSRIDADFIASVIRAESANNPQAVSHKGAKGLMQLMPETASNLGVQDSFDPAANVDGGVRYLRELLLRYNGDAVKALAAYNAGPARVQQYNGVPPYRETHAYVLRVVRDYNKSKSPGNSKQKSSTLAKSSGGMAPAATR